MLDTNEEAEREGDDDKIKKVESFTAYTP